MRMDKIEKIISEYYLEIEKGNNLVTMFSIYAFLMFCINIVTDSLLDNSSIYLKIGCNVFLLIIILKLYLHIRKKFVIGKVWTTRNMNINAFVLLSSLNIANGLISGTLIKIINLIKGVEDVIIPGTVADLGTNAETIIKVVIIGPIIEELIFRGAGLSLFRKKYNKLEAIIFTSIIFGLVHGNLAQAINSIIGGFIYGYAAIEFGVVYSIIFHMLNNGVVYLEYFLKIEEIIYIFSIVVLFLFILNIKKIKNNLKINFNRENEYSIKRQIGYFTNPPIAIWSILFIFQIVITI